VGLSPKWQPVSEPLNKPSYICDVEVHIVSEVGADVGVSVHHRAVERSPTYADNHRDQTQQQQDKAGISTHLIYKLEYRQTLGVSL